jgi:hypothetical protein
MWRIGRAPNSIPIYSYIQQDATSHSIFISGKCSTYFGWYFHPSSGAHLVFVTPLLLSAAIVEELEPVWVYCGWRTPPTSCKPVWRIPLLWVQWKTPDDGQMNCPKDVDFHSKNKFEKLVHQVGFIVRNGVNLFPNCSFWPLKSLNRNKMIMIFEMFADALNVRKTHSCPFLLNVPEGST